MDIQEPEALLLAWKEETGKDYFIQCEDGSVLASTCSLRNRFFREAAAGRISGDALLEQGSRLNLDFSSGRILLLLESEGLTASFMEEMTEAMLPGALEAESCFLEGTAGVLLLKKEELPDPAGAAESLLSALEVETVSRVRIGISRCFTEVSSLPTAMQEARLALLALKRFPGTAKLAFYEELGLKRLVLQMSGEQAEAYLSGFAEGLEQLLSDEELSRTADVFLATGLNSAETARQLIVHRNTLNYRLDKIQKLSGLDLKSFSDAAAYQLASLVWQNLKQC